MAHQVVTVAVNEHEELDVETRLRERILDVVRLGRRHYWEGEPGWRPWWSARQAVGGRFDGATFRRAVEHLLDEGRLIEVWLVPPDATPPPHLLVAPGATYLLRYPIKEARGRPDVLQKEGIT